MCMIKTFTGGGGKGVVDEEGVAVKSAWSGMVGGGGSLRDLSKNIYKQGVGKGESCSWGGGGFEGVTTPAPSGKF